MTTRPMSRTYYPAQRLPQTSLHSTFLRSDDGGRSFHKANAQALTQAVRSQPPAPGPAQAQAGDVAMADVEQPGTARRGTVLSPSSPSRGRQRFQSPAPFEPPMLFTATMTTRRGRSRTLTPKGKEALGIREEGERRRRSRSPAR